MIWFFSFGMTLRDDICKGDQILHTSIKKKKDIILIKLNSFMLP